MYRLFPVLVICLISCNHDTTKHRQLVQAKDTIHEIRLDSNYQGKDAFDWDWDWPTEKIILPTSITKYVAKGHEPIDTCTGDINEDDIPDLVLVCLSRV